MKQHDVIDLLTQVHEAKTQFAKAQTEFTAEVDYVMKRLLHEAARNYMSPEQVARASGLTVKRVRELMRRCGLDPRKGKRFLADAAAKAINSNAELLGCDPSEIDLMSPLAYLPAGGALKDALNDVVVSKVTEIEDDPWKETVLAWLEERTDILDFNGSEIPARLRDVLDHYPFTPIDLSGDSL